MQGFVSAQTRINLFDFHAVFAGLAETRDLTALEFVVDPGEFGWRQEHLLDMATTHFDVHALSEQEITHGEDSTLNKFWAQYYDAVSLPEDDEDNRWTRQLPLRCDPRDWSAQFVGADGKHSAPVTAEVWLWPFGWSSRLSILLNTPLSPGDLRRIVVEVETAKAFHLGKGRATAVALFKDLSMRMAKDLYGKAAVAGQPTIPRYLVVAIEKLVDHPHLAHDEEALTSLFYLTDGDQAALHSALLSETISVTEARRRWDDQKFTHTSFPNAGFGVTYFDRSRTLLVLDEGVYHNPKRPECLAANVTLCAMTAHCLMEAISCASRSDFKHNDRVKEWLEAARPALLEMPERYLNPFCWDLFGNHKRLKSWRAET